jgi:ATP-dependent Clp endopeptidase proteolytic subunit ClpP
MEKLYDKSYLEMIESLPQFEEYEFWKNIQNRKIILNQDISESLVERAIIQIINWNEQDDDNGIPKDERKTIKIYIYSSGGDVISGLGLISAIQNSVTKVETICLGLAASMGALLLCSGHVRTIYKNSTVLLHDGSLVVANSSKKAKQTFQFYDQLELRLKNFIIENTKITSEMYDSKHDEEWYIFGDEALELGIVDKVI